MKGILDYQPFKGMYIAYFVLSLLSVKLPYWTIKYSIRSQRPRRAWTLKRALIVRTIRELFSMKVDVGREQKAGRGVDDSTLTDAKFVWVEGIPDELFCGEIRRAAEITGTRPARIPGYWLLKKGYTWTGPKAKPGEKTLLHFHGGAFYIGSAHPSDVTANFTRGLLRYSKSLERTFAVDYRLLAPRGRPPANPFPAALLDAIAAYRYLVHDAGFEPQNVVLAGDSAGGNLVIAVVRHLLENPDPSLPPPGRILSASAWLDMYMSRRGPRSSVVLNAPTDIFDEPPPGEIFTWHVAVSLLGGMDVEEAKTNRYFSPVSLHVVPSDGLFKGFPETYVAAGGAERLLDDSKALVEKMRADGVEVVADIPPDAVHDFVVFTWHEPEHTESLRRISKWIDDM
ncbi:alpha/beta-hydrolase [Trametes elegans]|nr:alpha/beta-hydrolase [Trametes elegans]